jgi:hypothetical protein
MARSNQDELGSSGGAEAVGHEITGDETAPDEFKELSLKSTS